jgi:hypothetical protein
MKQVLWIYIGFNADPAFYLNAEPNQNPAFFYLIADLDPDPGSQDKGKSMRILIRIQLYISMRIRIQGAGQTLKSRNVEYFT